MSIELMTAVWKTDIGPATKRLVLLALADIANEEGVCWPAIATLARKANASRRRVEEVLADLEQDGTICKQHRWQSTTVYTINADALTPREICGDPPRGSRRPPAKSAGTPREEVGTEPSVEPPKEQTPLVSADAQTATNSQPGHDQSDWFALEEPAAVKAGVKKTRRSQAVTTVPDDFEVTLLMRQWFKDQGLAAVGVDGKLETAQFLDHHRAKGSKFKRWDLAWQTWMRNAGKFARQSRGGRVRLEDLPADDWRRFVQE